MIITSPFQHDPDKEGSTDSSTALHCRKPHLTTAFGSPRDFLDNKYVYVVVSARARGLPERRVVFRHALSNALIPIVTLLALDLPYIFTGAVLIETIFAWPGMGRLYYQAAVERDYPLLMAVLIIGAAFTTVVNSLVNDIIMPPIGYLMNGIDFSNFFLVLKGEAYPSLKAAQDAGAVSINGILCTTDGNRQAENWH